MENPFNYKCSINKRDKFIGRSSLISRVYSRIGADRPQSISLVGDPKIGKTSLLWYLSTPQTKQEFLHDPEKYLFLYLPLKELESLEFNDFSNILWYNICDIDNKNSLKFGDDFRYDLLKNLAERLNQEQRKLIMFFDDFHLITQHSSFPVEFFSFLRSLANNYNLAYVTTSHADLQKMCFSKEIEESPFFNIFTNMTIKPFNEEEALELLRLAENDLGEIQPTERQRLFNLTGFFPYTLQVGAKLWYDWKQSGNLLATENWKDFQNTFYVEAENYFANIWDAFKTEEKALFKQILTQSKVPKSQNYLLDNLNRRQYIIIENGKPQLFSPAFERYISEKCGLSVKRKRSSDNLLRRFKNIVRKLLRKNSENSNI